MSHRLARLGLWAAVTAAGTATAHPVVIYPGTIAWEGPRLVIELELDDHALEHAEMATGSTGSVTEMLARSLEVHTPDGQVRQAGRAGWSEPGRVELVVNLPPGPMALALRLRPDGALADLRQQWQLRWSPDSSSPRLVRLSAGGNAGVICQGAAQDAGHDRFTEPRLRLGVHRGTAGLQSAVAGSAESWHVTAELDVPCGLLPGWSGVFISEAPVVTARELAGIEARLIEWLRGHLSADGEGGAERLRIEGVRLMTVEDEVVPAFEDRPYSAFLTRVRISAVAEPAAGQGGMTLSWSGFNAAVQRLPAVLRTADGTQRIADLNAADGQVLIRRSEDGRSLILSAPSRSDRRAIQVPLCGVNVP